ncbi:random slug protein 5-like [Acanthaster planci]|uniref:Random slug protein 5-like n=1 Tax=Acanthaster planci TaxID=133434 RepID=A0A8B7XSU1_ACAPL|nr:random slug protein 5-like [Acanthaster planci]
MAPHGHHHHEPDEEEQSQRLNELQHRSEGLEDEEGFLNDKYNLLRYLRGYDWDVDTAYHKLKATLEWRQEHRPWEADCRYCEERPGFHSWRQVGIDKLGRPVVYSSFVQAAKHFTAEDNVQHTLFLMENAKKCMRPEEYRWVWVLDCSGLTLAACNPILARAVNHVVAEHYPERMGLVIGVNHGIFFEGIWRGFKLFIHPRTASKLRLCRGQHVDETFRELFPDDLREWLHQEIELNSQRHVSQAQIQFWRKPEQDGAHDPRGCPSYVSQYIDRYNKDVILAKINGNQTCKETRIHRPHPNIMQALREQATEKAASSTESD